jgi:hypothetical protein
MGFVLTAGNLPYLYLHEGPLGVIILDVIQQL